MVAPRGFCRAQELVLLNRRVTPDEAVSIGLVTRVVDDATLAVEALAVATQLAVGPTRALGRARQLLFDSFGASLEGHMEAESRAIADASRTSHGQAGIAAFT